MFPDYAQLLFMPMLEHLTEPQSGIPVSGALVGQGSLRLARTCLAIFRQCDVACLVVAMLSRISQYSSAHRRSDWSLCSIAR